LGGTSSKRNTFGGRTAERTAKAAGAVRISGKGKDERKILPEEKGFAGIVTKR